MGLGVGSCCRKICCYNVETPCSSFNRVVVKRLAAQTTTASGVVLPESAQDKLPTADVVSIGDDVKHVKAGDKVLLPEYGGAKVKLDGESYEIFEEDQLLAKVTSK